MRHLHLQVDIRAQPFAEEEDILDDAVTFVAERPDFVGGAGRFRSEEMRGRGARFAEAVETEDGAENAELEPADDEFLEIGRIDIAVVKPPISVVHQGIPLQADVETGTDLRLEGFKGGKDIAGPDGGAETLTAGPEREACGIGVGAVAGLERV